MYTTGGYGNKGAPDTVYVGPLSSTLDLSSVPDSSDALATLEYGHRILSYPETALLFASFIPRLDMFTIASGEYGLFDAAKNCQDTMHFGDWIIRVDRNELASDRSSRISEANARWQQALTRYEEETGCDPHAPRVTTTTQLVTHVEQSIATAQSTLNDLLALPPCEDVVVDTAQTSTTSPNFCTSTAGTSIVFGPDCS